MKHPCDTQTQGPPKNVSPSVCCPRKAGTTTSAVGSSSQGAELRSSDRDGGGLGRELQISERGRREQLRGAVKCASSLRLVVRGLVITANLEWEPDQQRLFAVAQWLCTSPRRSTRAAEAAGSSSFPRALGPCPFLRKAPSRRERRMLRRLHWASWHCNRLKHATC